MKRKQFTEAQIVGVLHEAVPGTSVREQCRQHRITETTFYRWRAKYGGLQVSEAKRLKALDDENPRLKKLVADLVLDNGMLNDVVGRKWRRPLSGAPSTISWPAFPRASAAPVA